MPLFVAGKIAAARRVGYPPHGGIVLPSVPKLGNGIRRHLIAIIFSAAADIFLDGAVRRHDVGKGIDDALIAEELGVGGQIAHAEIILSHGGELYGIRA